MKISIFGAGYVGLVTGACLAELGNEVLCCDTDSSKVAKLKSGESPFYEPGLNELVQRNSKEGRLSFSSDTEQSVKHGDIIFIAVGTPSKESGEADLQYVYSVAESVGKYLNRERVVVVTKSTVPAGTTEKVGQIVAEQLKKRATSLNFAAVSNPEFLREGKAIEDFMVPDRVVVGTEQVWAGEIMKNLYTPLLKKDQPFFLLNTVSSELTKYASNVFIAARISLINELSQIAELVGADIEEIRKAIGADKRIGMQYLYPGVGYGGSCFPKDVRALAHLAKSKGHSADMVASIETANEKQRAEFAKKILGRLKDPAGKKVAVWGLSFKPKTDDIRYAPAVYIIGQLLKAGAQVSVYDPVAGSEGEKFFGGKVEIAQDMYACLSGADCLVICTEWAQFNEPDFGKIKAALKQPVIFDGRNIYSPARMGGLGLTYISIGRPQVGV